MEPATSALFDPTVLDGVGEDITGIDQMTARMYRSIFVFGLPFPTTKWSEVLSNASSIAGNSSNASTLTVIHKETTYAHWRDRTREQLAKRTILDDFYRDVDKAHGGPMRA